MVAASYKDIILNVFFPFLTMVASTSFLDETLFEVKLQKLFLVYSLRTARRENY